MRPLYAHGASEAKAATRDYVFELDTPGGAAAVVDLMAANTTTYRCLAEEALERLAPYLNQRQGQGGLDRTPRRCPAATSDVPAGGADCGTPCATIRSCAHEHANPAGPTPTGRGQPGFLGHA